MRRSAFPSSSDRRLERCAPPPARVEPAQALAARAGTTGLGAELGVVFGSTFGLRAQLATGSHAREQVQSNISDEGKRKLSSRALLLDLHPFAGSVRLSAGAVYNNNQLDATGQGQSGTIEIIGIS